MLNTLGIFAVSTLAPAEIAICAEKKHYFWFGEVGTAAVLAGIFTVDHACIHRCGGAVPAALSYFCRN
jgi:hypothetical protein